MYQRQFEASLMALEGRISAKDRLEEAREGEPVPTCLAVAAKHGLSEEDVVRLLETDEGYRELEEVVGALAAYGAYRYLKNRRGGYGYGGYHKPGLIHTVSQALSDRQIRQHRQDLHNINMRLAHHQLRQAGVKTRAMKQKLGSSASRPDDSRGSAPPPGQPPGAPGAPSAIPGVKDKVAQKRAEKGQAARMAAVQQKLAARKAARDKSSGKPSSGGTANPSGAPSDRDRKRMMREPRLPSAGKASAAARRRPGQTVAEPKTIADKTKAERLELIKDALMEKSVKSVRRHRCGIGLDNGVVRGETANVHPAYAGMAATPFRRQYRFPGALD